jgi:DNA-binding protein
VAAQGAAETTAENEIRVAVAGKVSSYLGYAFRILNKSEHRSLTIRATGNAIVKALILIELVKRRIGDLHQLNTIHSMVIEDEFKTKGGEGIDNVKQVRRVTALDCVLSKDELDQTQVGYQEPVPREERTQLPPRKREKPANRDAKDGKDGANNASKSGKDGNKDGKTRHHGGRRTKRYNAVEDDAPNN